MQSQVTLKETITSELSKAISKNNLKQVKLLVSSGNLTLDDYVEAIQLAAERASSEIVDFLI